MGFKVSHSDPCIFIHHKNSNTAFISSHVNDLGLFFNSKSEITTIKSEFLKYVKIKDLGEIKSILGIEVIHDHEKCTISILHCQYIIKWIANLFTCPWKWALAYRSRTHPRCQVLGPISKPCWYSEPCHCDDSS